MTTFSIFFIEFLLAFVNSRIRIHLRSDQIISSIRKILLFSLLLINPVYALDEAYWIWAGRTVDERIPEKSTLYIHQGTIECKDLSLKPKFKRQGLGTVYLKNHPLYLVYRIENLKAKKSILAIFNSDAKHWENKGNVILGLQLDFDSPSKKLEYYVRFLKQIREMLDSKYKLSITGLADWASSSSASVLDDILSVSDELIFQLYEGKFSIPNLNQYLKSISKISNPIKLGILENQRYILSNKTIGQNIQGIVIFK